MGQHNRLKYFVPPSHPSHRPFNLSYTPIMTIPYHTPLRIALALLCLFCGISMAAELESTVARYCFDDATGRISHIVDKRSGEVPVESIFNYYNVLAKSGDFGGNEKSDHVEKSYSDGAAQTASNLVYECTNPKLPDLQIIKRYWIENDALRRELTFVNNSSEKRFLQNATESKFSEPFLKDAYYFGAGYLGPYEPAPRPKNYVRVDQYVQSSKGMVLSNHNPKLGSYANYRVKINDNVVYPWWQSTIGRYREQNDRLYYTPFGWSMCHGTLDLEPNGGSIRYTDCFAFFQGDISNFFYDVFGKDSDFQRDLKSISKPPEWVLDLLCVASPDDGYLKYLTQMCDEGQILVASGFNGDWADYRWEDGCNGMIGGFITADEWREFTRFMHALSPRIKLCHYGITVAADIYSPIFTEHPEWFRKYQRNGAIDSLFPGMQTNFQTMFNRDDCRRFMANDHFDNARAFQFDMVYMDEAQQHNTINWQTMELIRDDHLVDLWKQMRQRGDQEQIPLFMNGSGQPYADINYIEAVLRMQSSRWREFAGVAMGLEWFSLFRPTGRIVPLYWYPRRMVDYHNRCLALGWIPRPQTNFRSQLVRSPLGTIRAAYETGKTLPVPVRYTPDWKVDPAVEMESYTVRRLDSDDMLLSFISRSDEKREFPVTVDLRTLGFAEKDDVNIFLLATEYCTGDQPNYTLSDHENKENYRKYGWYGGTITMPELIYSGKPDHTFRLTLPPMVRDDMVQMLVTRAPAGLYTLDDLPLNYFYTKRKGIEIKGDMIISSREKAEIILADLHYEFTDVKLNGKPAVSRTADLNGRYGQLVTIVTIPKGEHRLSYTRRPRPTYKPAPPPIPILKGRTLTVEGEFSNRWLYAIDFKGRTMATVHLPYTLPEQVEDGTYLLRHAGLSRSLATPFAIANGKPSIHKLESTLLVHPEENVVQPLEMTVKGVKVTAQAVGHGSWNDPYHFQRNLLPYEHSATPETLTISAGSSRRERGEAQGLIPPAFAGLELTGAKQLSFSLENSFFHCPSIRAGADAYWLNPATNFIGLVVDYRVEGKYVKRTAFSVGSYNSKMKNDYPHWGANKVQDQLIDLGSLIEEKNRHEFSLDLAKYAPPEWDGTLFLSVGTAWPQPRRKLTLTIREVNNANAVDFLEGFDAASTVAPPQIMPNDLALTKLKNPPAVEIKPERWANWAKIPSLLPFLNNNDKLLEQPTEAYLAYDATYFYIAVRCQENKRTPMAENSTPWRNECVELYWKTENGKICQLICDAAGNLYSPEFDVKLVKTTVKTVEKDGWYMLAALPWSAIGLNDATLGTKLRFNLIRNRLGSRPEVSTWGPIKSGYR
ncbi:MAG: hypothetical protein IKR81_01045, partial [Victivallales bacterium]|nr:hypothetical protein [Victivallales bacterium]